MITWLFRIIYYIFFFFFFFIELAFYWIHTTFPFIEYSLLDFYIFIFWSERKRTPCITSLFSLTQFPRRFAFSFLVFHTGISPPSAKFEIRVLWKWSLDVLRSQVSWAEVALRLWSMLRIKTISKTWNGYV